MSRATLSGVDTLLTGIEEGLRSVFGRPRVTGRADPADAVPEAGFSDAERRVSVGLMRVNHAGEVAAQGLYQGQALTARLPEVRASMEQAAREENDHLAWCRGRVEGLGGRTSVLDPLWFAGSYAIGAVAGIAGDKWSLGFVAETEHQVIRHLDGHLARLPKGDAKSRAIIEQMREDEGRHATVALEAGGAPLPAPVRGLMSVVSKVMTATAYRI
jgi:ubiquinone biosynthesis monooxygenase Coq7